MKPCLTAFQFPLNNVFPLSFSLALGACTWYNALIWNISIDFSNQGFLKSLILQGFSWLSLLSHYLQSLRFSQCSPLSSPRFLSILLFSHATWCGYFVFLYCGVWFSSLFLFFSYPIHPVFYTLSFTPHLKSLTKLNLSVLVLVKVMRNSTYKVGWEEWGTNLPD